MSQELFYDRGIKKWRSFDSDTGEIGGIVRDNDPYFMVNMEAYRRLAGTLGLSGLGFFGVLVGFMEYKNRVSLSYRKIVSEYGISTATIKRHLDELKRYNIIIEQKSERGRRYYLVNGEYAFRGSRSQMAENAKIFKENAYQLKKARIDGK
jgi:hypothetical protein